MENVRVRVGVGVRDTVLGMARAYVEKVRVRVRVGVGVRDTILGMA